MHEGNFTEQIVEALLSELSPYAGARPKRVCVEVGEMLHLIPETVRAHYEMLTRGTPLAGAELELQEVPVRVLCDMCGQRGTVEDHHVLLCPCCGASRVKVLSGREVIIRSIELEEMPEGGSDEPPDA